MIEDETDGIKIAENSEEAFWKDVEDRCIRDIKTAERTMKINEKVKDLAEKEQKKIPKKDKIDPITKLVG